MPDEGPALRVGDWVRILRLPAEFAAADHQVEADTVSLFERLIREGRAHEIIELDDDGLPWIEYRGRGHSTVDFLALLDDSWELVEPEL